MSEANPFLAIPFYYIIMSQREILLGQVIEEILREKTNRHVTLGVSPDFWLLVSPFFIGEEKLDAKIRTSKFYQDKKDSVIVEWAGGGYQEFYAALVTPDENYMNWIKLRLGYFEDIEASRDSLASTSYTSDGVCGTLMISEDDKFRTMVLASNYQKMHPDVMDHGLCNKIDSFYRSS
jgi:hypothetical protein